ncbi:sialate O-acetylesterase [Paenibacillus sp. PAMC21692]|uniref:sialate O-acetylesterase n=1 Tax=Paenibacillus sp. PAMC21692 TaxID=2762320 RepID=UPI00164ECFAF|nr:sialate O-acetylesterase [Paenibacillus sp. PAMC21692]QNK60319.1 sialate O-acetylesterase [Paenibacillus sp. PAMC21692]
MQIGAIIDKGPMDWQIVQQTNGSANISLSGSWTAKEDNAIEPKVFVRIVNEETGEVIIPWKGSANLGKAQWEITIADVPAGGLYRLETCLSLNADHYKAMEWAVRGDMIHHIGVGDVFVIAGQSNAAGYGKDPIYDPPELGLHLLRNNGHWALAAHPMNESTGIIHEANREVSNPGHSPYLSFARKLKRELGYPIGLIQTACGSSPLSAWNPEEDGYLYRNMMDILQSQGVGTIKGVLWYQGCSDTAVDESATYLDRFKRIVARLREDRNDAELPLLTVQLNRWVHPVHETSNQNWGRLREAQRQAARQIAGVYVVPAIDCSLSDSAHISASSNLVLGERLARTALKYLYGKPFICDAPDIEEAIRIGPAQIRLTFKHISDRLFVYDEGADGLPFVAEDEEGFLHAVGYELEDPHSIAITLGREWIGECWVHGASEQNPKSFVPVDFASHLPMLSFYGVRVTEQKPGGATL